jgi:hypothetical protein
MFTTRPKAAALLGAAILVFQGGRPSNASAPPTPPSPSPGAISSEALRRYFAHLGRIETLGAEYVSTERHGDGPADHSDSVVSWRLLVKGRRRLLEVTHTNSEVGAKDDPQHGISLYDGVSFNAAYPLERVYEVSVKKALPVYTIKVRGNPVQECLGWWPAADTSEPPEFDGRPFFLRASAPPRRSKDRPGTEEVHGRRCLVVEVDDLDVLWIDAATGNLMRRVHYFDASRRFAMEYDLSDFRPVAAGLELPHLLIRRFVQNEPREVRAENRYAVSGYEVNNVTEAAFAYTPPPGTLIHDRDTDYLTQVPGGLDLLDVVVDRVRRFLPEPPAGSATAGSPRGWLAPAAGAGAAILLALLRPVAAWRPSFRRTKGVFQGSPTP